LQVLQAGSELSGVWDAVSHRSLDIQRRKTIFMVSVQELKR
jgi:hypothetical protein